MARKLIKLAMVANEKSRDMSLKKRRLELVKKIRELMILCDIKSCMIMFNPNETEPMVWPSVEEAHSLLDDFFALLEFERMNKGTTLDSYLKKKTRRIHEKLRRTQMKNKVYAMDQLMVQLGGECRIDDLNLNDIYRLISFSKDKIMQLRRVLDFMQHSTLPEPPVNPFEAQSEEPKTAINDNFMIGDGRDDERAMMADERAQKIINIGALRETRSYYVMDQWVLPPPELPNSQIHQKIGMEMASYNQTSNHIYHISNKRSYHPYQGSDNNVNSNLEMQPIGQPVITFHGVVGSVSQPLQNHHSMNNSPIMTISQPRQYPFDFMSREERSNINIDGSQFHFESNVMTTNDGLRQEPPPDEAPFEEGNADATPFDINRNWQRFNNNHHI